MSKVTGAKGAERPHGGLVGHAEEFGLCYAERSDGGTCVETRPLPREAGRSLGETAADTAHKGGSCWQRLRQRTDGRN